MNMITIANAFYGPDNISGGDFIFSEYNKQWKNSGVSIKACTNENGYEFCVRQGITPKEITIFKSCFLDGYGIYVANITRTACSILYAFKVNWRNYDYVFSASDFLPDALPAVIAKLFNPKIKWVAAFYLFTPALFDKNYNGRKLRLLFYKVSQRISLFFMCSMASFIFTASVKDKEKFINKFKVSPNKVVAVRGGIDFKLIDSIKGGEKSFDAVFMSRLHPQKNPDELIEIWAQVCNKKLDAKLAVIGSGVEEKKMKRMINDFGIYKNVTFFGTLVGENKIRTLRSAKIFISATKFDSGILAMDEAMACGLVGIIYDLPLANYPQGVIKVEMGNKEQFANTIVTTLADSTLVADKGRDAYEFAKTLDWKPMAKRALDFITR